MPRLKSLRGLIFILMFSLCTCGDTNLIDAIEINTGGGQGGSQNDFVPGEDLQIVETSQSDFQSGTLTQVEAAADGSLKLERNIVGETGRVLINEEVNFAAPTTINFRNTYVSPVVITYIVTRNNPESLDARATNVTSTSADVFIEDPLDDGIGAAETLVYLVIEEGRHNFASGLTIEAGIHSTTSEHSSGDGFGGDVVLFSAAFASLPAIFHSLNTFNNGDFKSTICDSVSTTQFTVEQETADTSTATALEDIAWVAISQGQGSQIDFTYDVGLADNGGNQGVDDLPQDIPLTGFGLAPDILVKGSSGGGADGYWMRGAGTWTNTNHDGYAEEDQNGDGERAHANETFNYAAFDPDSEIGVYQSSGVRTLEDIDLSRVKVVESSNISYSVSLPAGTSFSIETRVSLDSGASWSTWTVTPSGSEIPELTSGADVENGILQVRLNFATTDEEQTPALNSLDIEVNASQTQKSTRMN